MTQLESAITRITFLCEMVPAQYLSHQFLVLSSTYYLVTPSEWVRDFLPCMTRLKLKGKQLYLQKVDASSLACHPDCLMLSITSHKANIFNFFQATKNSANRLDSGKAEKTSVKVFIKNLTIFFVIRSLFECNKSVTYCYF